MDKEFFPTEVGVSSLPWSLRHGGCKQDIIREARDIAVFLHDATMSEEYGNTSNMGDAMNGLRLCYSLLIDKLDIAIGDYRFPAGTHDSSAPKLCERIKR